MTGLFNTLNTANKGLTAQQLSLHITGHNIANIGTRGYNRQRLEMVADYPHKYPSLGQIGTGVKMTAVTRSVSAYLGRQVRNELGNLERYNASNEALDQLELIFNEPSKTGLNYNLSEMFTAWSELGSNPELSTSQTVVVEKSKTLVDSINHMANKINSLRDGVESELDGNMLDFNTALDKLEGLNKQIANLALKGDVPNDLLDQRDLLVQDMGAIVDFEADYDEYGRVSISMGDQELINKDGVQGKLAYEDGKLSINDKEGNPLVEDASSLVHSGQIKGKFEALDEIDANMDKLNKFTKTMAEAINKIHSGDGESIDFFTIEDDSNPALSIKVNKEISEDHSKVNVGRDFEGGLAGDGSRAQAIAKLQDSKIDFINGNLEYDEETMGIKPSEKGMTIKNAYGKIVTEIGVAKKHSDDMMSNQIVVVEQLLNKQESVSGVSLNEEISDMIKFQQAYNANAKVISVISEMLDTLIHGTGL